MNVLNETLRQAAADLDHRKLPWALVGGFAVSARAEPRFTRDLEIAAAAEVLEVLPKISVPVATAGHLIALKLLARNDDSRPQDLIDLNALYAAATPADLASARQAIALITERGFHRERDLLSAFENLISSASRPSSSTM